MHSFYTDGKMKSCVCVCVLINVCINVGMYIQHQQKHTDKYVCCSFTICVVRHG
jgi:hypothetical protein